MQHIKIIRKVKGLILSYIYLYFGLKLSINVVSCFNFFRLKKQLGQFKKQGKKSHVYFPVTKLYPCYEDRLENAGSLEFHYFYQDLYVAQRIFQNNPSCHIDIGSRISGFIVHVASFRKVEVFDIRPLHNFIPNVQFRQVDIMVLAEDYIDSTDSISCLHALEHIGLGRYRDPICYDGYWQAFQNIYKILKNKGKFYFSVPLGKQRVEFHAHRVFSLKYLLEMIEPLYEIETFSYVDDKNVFFMDVHITEEIIENNCNCNYGCAIFELIKKINTL